VGVDLFDRVATTGAGVSQINHHCCLDAVIAELMIAIRNVRCVYRARLTHTAASNLRFRGRFVVRSEESRYSSPDPFRIDERSQEHKKFLWTIDKIREKGSHLISIKIEYGEA